MLNVNEPDDYERARSRAAPSVTVRRYGTLATNLGREPIAIRAATLRGGRDRGRAWRSTGTSWPR